MAKPQAMNLRCQLFDALRLWVCAGRPAQELESIIRVVAERAFIASTWPSVKKISLWRAEGCGPRRLITHIHHETGRLIGHVTAQRLWTLFTNQPQPRRRNTIADFIRDFPETWRCQSCRTTHGPFEVDHVIPLRVGGADKLTNLQVLCRECNRGKGSKLDGRRIYLEFQD